MSYYLGRITEKICEWVDDSDRTDGKDNRGDSRLVKSSAAEPSVGEANLRGFSAGETNIRGSSAGESSVEEPKAQDPSAEEFGEARLIESEPHHRSCTRGWSQECHVRTVENLRGQVCWEKIVLNCWCLLCLADEPQHVFSCTHAVCDTCVKLFGRPLAEQEYCYSFTACPLCGTPSTLRVILRPPTAGIRIMSIDGGGVRGTVPLKFLKLLQAAIGRAGRIQDYFDIGFCQGLRLL